MYNTNWGICDFDNQTFVVFNTNGVKWEFSYLDLGIGTPEVINIYHTHPVHWTNDGNFVYLSTRPDGYDPLGPFLGTGIALLKLDLTNGEITTVLPNVNRFYSISISPSGKYLAYSLFNEPIQVNIVDTQSGESSTVFSTEEYDQVGEYVWSDDDTRLVYKYIITGDECFRIYSINTLSLTDFENETIIKDAEVNTCQPSDPTFYIESVTNLDVILKQSDDIWFYEVGSQKMRFFTKSTPQP